MNEKKKKTPFRDFANAVMEISKRPLSDGQVRGICSTVEDIDIYRKNPIDEFVENAEKIRKMPLGEEAIKRINNALKIANDEEGVR